MKIIHICSIFTFINLWLVCNTYRILGVFPFNAKSHSIVYEALMKGLAQRGHQVDVVTHFPLENPPKNYKDIINLDGSMDRVMNNYSIEFVSQIAGDIVDIVATTYGNKLCDFLGFKKMQHLIKNPPTNPPYDLVITEAFGASCFMGLGYVFKVPVVAVSSAIEYPWVSHFIGNDDNLAIVPNAYHVGFGKLNFWERLKNVVTNFLALRQFHILTEEIQTKAMKKYLSPDIPNVRIVEKNVALTLVNSHPILFGVKPITPSLVQIAGLHIEGNDQILSLELQKWMDDSRFGVVYFSMGSMVLIETLPKEQLKEIFTTFEKISPIRVLIKIVDKSKLSLVLPENIKVLPWIPQQPVLAHPNMKIFITHGGLGGLQEALHFGVPTIGIPLFTDQFRNVEAFVYKQMMIRIDFKNLSGKSLESSLQILLHNPIYKEKSMYYSKLFRQRPISPMNNAIYWIEYVIRNGAEPLRSTALQLSWWQLALLDVYGFILILILSSIILILLCFHLILRKLFKKSKNII